MSIKEEVDQVLEVAVIESTSVVSVDKPEEDAALNEDFANARKNMYELIDAGKDLLEGISNLARVGETPRPYEVAGDILSKLVQAQKDLVELHQRKGMVEKKKEETSPTSTPINIEGNAIFTGSTTDLIRMLQKE